MGQRVSAGYSSCDITPETPVAMCGYGVFLGRHAHGVLDHLYVKAVILEHASKRLALFSFDLIGFSPDFCDRLRSETADAIGTEPELVTIVCTHTHSGPPSGEIRGMGEVDDEYQDHLAATCRQVGMEAVSDLVEVDAQYVCMPIEPFAYNRIDQSFDNIDPNLSVLALFPQNKRDSAPILITHYACHPVTLGVNDLISADFPGRIVQKLKKCGYRPMFFQGFCGNINPLANSSFWGHGAEPDLDRYGNHIAERVCAMLSHAEPIEISEYGFDTREFSVPLSLDFTESPESHEALLKSAYGSVGEKKIGRFVASWRSEWDLASHGPEPYKVVDLPVQIVTLGTIQLICVGAEVFSTLGNQLRQLYPRAIPVGYANGVVGYLPDSGAYDRPSDYAAYLAPHFYRSAPFVRDAPERFMSALRTAMEDVR